MSGITYGSPQRITEVKAAGDGAWEVSGFAATYDRDLGNDRIAPGAFKDTLATGRRVRFLYAHDPAQTLGTALELRETDGGLFGRFRISKTRLGEEVRTLLHDEALDSFSIGFLTKEADFDEETKTRHLKALDLVECSIVALPMNPAARITSYKDVEWGDLPIEDALNLSSLGGDEALRLVNALWERRREAGQRPSDRLVALVEAYRQKCQAQSDALLTLLTTPAPAKKDAASPGESLVDAHLRRARISEYCRQYGVTVP